MKTILLIEDDRALNSGLTYDLEINVSCEEALMAYFDKRWTGEALFNIVDNSVKYTKDGGQIDISAGETDFFVRIRIKDNGRGIAEDRIPMIFKRFYREPESADTEGVGIGLYLAREIVMKQRGFIEVRSRACLKNHSYHLHAPLCVIFAPNSGCIAHYAPFIWHKSPTNCDAHLAESIFQTRSKAGEGTEVCVNLPMERK